MQTVSDNGEVNSSFQNLVPVNVLGQVFFNNSWTSPWHIS